MLGNAYYYYYFYYYYAGKDELVHALYVQVQREHRDHVLPRLIEGAPLADNLRLVLHSGIDVMTPFHGFGSAFFQQALPPASSSSPFSTESTDARMAAVNLMDHFVALSVPGRSGDETGR